MKFKVSAELPLPADVYFVERDSAAFRSLVAQMCKLESLEIGNSWMKGDVEVYEFITRPDVEKYVPHQFKHFLPGGDLHYTDVIEYDPSCIARSPYRMRVHSVPPIFSSKAKIESWLTIEEVTPTTCRQTLEGSIEVKILGLGHLTEHIVVDNLKSVYKGVPKIVERWSQFRAEVLEKPGGKDILVAGRPKNVGVDWISDQLKALLRAPDTSSDTVSAASDSTGGELSDHLPSVEEMLERCSIDNSHPLDEETDEDDLFFDAREDVSWADLNNFVSGNPSLERRMRKDSREAGALLANLSKSGRRLRKVEVDAPRSPTAEHAGRLRAMSSRFSQNFNSELLGWKEFWEEHEVPQTKHAPHLHSRLGNLFNFGAAAGLFKPGKHTRRKHKKKQKKADVAGESFAGTEHSASDSHTTEDSAGGRSLESSKSSKNSGSQKSDHRSKSGGLVKDLFKRKKSHAAPEADTAAHGRDGDP